MRSQWINRFARTIATAPEVNKLPPLVYECDLSLIADNNIRDKFVQLHYDEDTRKFVEERCLNRGVLASIKDSIAMCLKMCLSNTDANAITGRSEMHVLTASQAKLLIGDHADPHSAQLLDVGAGSGRVTDQMRKYFSHTVTTEVSKPMAEWLRKRGYECIETAEVTPEILNYRKFDVVSCLNVLDRCSKPVTLLRQMRELLADRGVLILAVVLPFSAFVEVGAQQRAPEEDLPMDGYRCECYSCTGRKGGRRPKFEEASEAFIARVLRPLGYEVEQWTRLPYISEGDWNQPYYVLEDLVLVLRASSAKESLLPLNNNSLGSSYSDSTSTFRRNPVIPVSTSE